MFLSVVDPSLDIVPEEQSQGSGNQWTLVPDVAAGT